MHGKIRSLETPWPKFNDAGTNGLEWGSTTIIGARPGNGKTLICDQIIREGFKRNPAENFSVLSFQLEMPAKNSAIREFSAILGRSYKYLCSADGTLSKENYDLCLAHAKEAVKYPVNIVEKSPTVQEFTSIIHQYMEHHAMMENVTEETILGDTTSIKEIYKKVYKNTIISLDHTILMKKGKGEDTLSMLYALGEALTMLKRMYPIVFIVLSQLNRDIEKPERCENGKYSNGVISSDFFGADAMLMHADIQIGLTIPGKRKIRFYSTEKYIIENEHIIAAHFIKCRNGDTRTSFFKAEFDKMQIVEMTTPPQQKS